MYCKMCGSKIDGDSKFCFNCGSSVESANQNGESAQNAAPVQNGMPVYYQQPVQSTTDYNSLAIVFGVVSIVFCIWLSLLSLGFGIAAIAVSSKYKNEEGKSGAGKVLGILGVVFSSIILLIKGFFIILPIFIAAMV